MCPPASVQAFLALHRRAGLMNAVTHVSRKGDTRRWIHNYRSGNPDLSAADELYLPDMLAPRSASPRLPARGRLVVPGYLVTRRFQVWVGDGQRGRVEVKYDLDRSPPELRVVDNPGGYSVRLLFDSPLAVLPRA
jgi:hypothetical protein